MLGGKRRIKAGPWRRASARDSSVEERHEGVIRDVVVESKLAKKRDDVVGQLHLDGKRRPDLHVTLAGLELDPSPAILNFLHVKP